MTLIRGRRTCDCEQGARSGKCRLRNLIHGVAQVAGGREVVVDELGADRIEARVQESLPNRSGDALALL